MRSMGFFSEAGFALVADLAITRLPSRRPAMWPPTQPPPSGRPMEPPAGLLKSGMASSVCWPGVKMPPPPPTPAPPATATAGSPRRGEAALAGAVLALAQLGIEHLVVGRADEGEGEHDEDDRDARRQQVPPGRQTGRAVHPGVVQHGAPAEVERVAEAEERERRLREDGDGHDEHEVGEDERHHVGQHVLGHDVPVARADRLGALDEAAARARAACPSGSRARCPASW